LIIWELEQKNCNLQKQKKIIMRTSALLIALVVGFLTSSVSAQETVWFDANWNLTEKDKLFTIDQLQKNKTMVFGLLIII